MSTLLPWIGATLTGDERPCPTLALSLERQTRTWWMALLQALTVHSKFPAQDWRRMFERLQGVVGPSDLLDGKPILLHLVSLRSDEGIRLVLHAMPTWNIADFLPEGPASMVRSEAPNHRWAWVLLDQLGTSNEWATQGLVNVLINRTGSEHEHWRTDLMQKMMVLDASRSPHTRRSWWAIARRLREQGQLDLPLLRDPVDEQPSHNDPRPMKTLDLLLHRLMTTQLNGRRFTESPWSSALQQALGTYTETSGSCWAQTLGRLERLTDRLERRKHAQDHGLVDAWNIGLRGLLETIVLRQTAQDVMVAPAASPPRRRL